MIKRWNGFILNALAAITLTTTVFTTEAQATNSLGVVVGDPTGLSGRFGLDSKHSIDGALAYSSGYYEGLHIHATYLWDHARSFATKQGPIELYYGLGGRLITIQHGKYDGDVALGGRAPLGLLYNFHNPNLELFGELALTLDIAPKTDVTLDAGIGLRIRF